MCVGSTSSAETAAFGLPVRKGSISTRVSPSLSSKQAWPRKRMSIRFSSGSVVVEFSGQLPADRDSHQHPDPRLLGEQRPDRTDAVVGIGGGRRLQQLALVRLAEPAALVQRLGEYPRELGGDAADARLRRAEALGVGECLESGVDLRVRELPLGHPAHNRQVRLTALSHGAGCACKIPPGALHPLLAELPRSADPALLVGHESADDAAVYRVSDDLAIVTTVDFFTPIVDDPYDFGRIAATNALSDVYAMGGRPLTALNLLAYSLDELGDEPLREILRGGAAAAAAADVAVVGGPSIDDREPKYGMAVTGAVHPDRLMRNSTARAGDALFLTKPVGGGVVSTAAKRGVAPPGLVDAVVNVMTTLNRDASEAALAAGASAATDVTGFGLLGHLHELAEASGVAAEVDARAVPAIDGVLELLASPEPPLAGATRRNRDWVEPWVDWDDGVPEDLRWLLCDAMTSGGLLIAAAPDSGAPGTRIGRVTAGAEPGRIAVR